MQFKRTIEKDPNQHDFPHPEYSSIYWISGDYKIVFYYRITHHGFSNWNRQGKNPGYAAYWNRGGAEWGWYVNKEVPFYKTLREAKEACQTHQTSLTPKAA